MIPEVLYPCLCTQLCHETLPALVGARKNPHSFPVICLTVVDEYVRECLAMGVGGSFRSCRVIELRSR